MPAVNISETNDAITIEVAAPGMKKKDFSVELNDNQLCISYKKEMRHNDQDEKKMYGVKKIISNHLTGFLKFLNL